MILVAFVLYTLFAGLTLFVAGGATGEADFAIEQTVEDVLTANEIVFSKDETWIEKERMQMVVYTTEVLINGSE